MNESLVKLVETMESQVAEMKKIFTDVSESRRLMTKHSRAVRILAKDLGLNARTIRVDVLIALKAGKVARQA